MGSVESSVCEIVPFSSQLACVSDNLSIVNYSSQVNEKYILNSIAPINLSNEFKYTFMCGKNDLHTEEGNIICNPVTGHVDVLCGSKSRNNRLITSRNGQQNLCSFTFDLSNDEFSLYMFNHPEHLLLKTTDFGVEPTTFNTTLVGEAFMWTLTDRAEFLNKVSSSSDQLSGPNVESLSNQTNNLGLGLSNEYNNKIEALTSNRNCPNLNFHNENPEITSKSKGLINFTVSQADFGDIPMLISNLFGTTNLKKQILVWLNNGEMSLFDNSRNPKHVKIPKEWLNSTSVDLSLYWDEHSSYLFDRTHSKVMLSVGNSTNNGAISTNNMINLNNELNVSADLSNKAEICTLDKTKVCKSSVVYIQHSGGITEGNYLRFGLAIPRSNLLPIKVHLADSENEISMFVINSDGTGFLMSLINDIKVKFEIGLMSGSWFGGDVFILSGKQALESAKNITGCIAFTRTCFEKNCQNSENQMVSGLDKDLIGNKISGSEHYLFLTWNGCVLAFVPINASKINTISLSTANQSIYAIGYWSIIDGVPPLTKHDQTIGNDNSAENQNTQHVVVDPSGTTNSESNESNNQEGNQFKPTPNDQFQPKPKPSVEENQSLENKPVTIPDNGLESDNKPVTIPEGNAESNRKPDLSDMGTTGNNGQDKTPIGDNIESTGNSGSLPIEKNPIKDNTENTGNTETLPTEKNPIKDNTESTVNSESLPSDNNPIKDNTENTGNTETLPTEKNPIKDNTENTGNSESLPSENNPIKDNTENTGNSESLPSENNPIKDNTENTGNSESLPSEKNPIKDNTENTGNTETLPTEKNPIKDNTESTVNSESLPAENNPVKDKRPSTGNKHDKKPIKDKRPNKGNKHKHPNRYDDDDDTDSEDEDDDHLDDDYKFNTLDLPDRPTSSVLPLHKKDELDSNHYGHDDTDSEDDIIEDTSKEIKNKM
ncbi:serine/threonine rich low complexity protein [Cryptosporidium canis]|uniref:Serine/threonine rich low complexity protein n=1 Tax=Cryptosporidium canis TaxID=195482 RepID=A0A9D5DI54_9CRYT|nr:serine/threonine rich low complexity protein [Cryptosporidium canis]